MKTIPKSLHTVTVLVAVARELGPMNAPACAIRQALKCLGYADSPDSYQLADKARAILAREVRS